MELTNNERTLDRAQDLSELIAEEIKKRGLTLFEVSMALQSIENISRDVYGEPFDAAWNLAKRVWMKAKSVANA